MSSNFADSMRRSAAARGRLAVLLLGMTLAACDVAPPGSSGAVAIRDGRNGMGERPEAELVARFEAEAVAWIRSERESQRPRSAPLPPSAVAEFAAYFPNDLLDRVRLREVRGFENPEFFSIFAAAGEPYPLDLRRARALALVDTILVAAGAEGSRRRGLLFHELVHVMQFEVLGLEGYMAGYVASWAGNGRSYREIPHENQAFELAARFAAGGEPFSVDDEVRSLFIAAPAAKH